MCYKQAVSIHRFFCVRVCFQLYLLREEFHLKLRWRGRSRGIPLSWRHVLRLQSLTNNVETWLSPSDCCCSEDQMSQQAGKVSKARSSLVPEENSDEIQASLVSFVHEKACVFLCVCAWYWFSGYPSDREMDRKRKKQTAREEKEWEKEWHKYKVNKREPAALREKHREEEEKTETDTERTP